MTGESISCRRTCAMVANSEVVIVLGRGGGTSWRLLDATWLNWVTPNAWPSGVSCADQSSYSDLTATIGQGRDRFAPWLLPDSQVIGHGGGQVEPTVPVFSNMAGNFLCPRRDSLIGLSSLWARSRGGCAATFANDVLLHDSGQISILHRSIRR